MAEWVWDLLNSAAAGGAVWLSIILVLALLGEIGLPFTCPIIEGLLVFTGFQLAQGSLFVATLPFLAAAFAGRFIGSTSAYELSGRIGVTVMSRYGERLRLTPQRVELLRDNLAYLVVPTIILARFTPGFTVLTSFLCGISRIDRRRFLGAVALQIVAWEAGFLTLGALGGAAARSTDPSSYPWILAIIVAVAIGLSIAVGYLILYKARRREPERPMPHPTTRVSHAR